MLSGITSSKLLLVDKIGISIAGYELDRSLNSNMIESLNQIGPIKTTLSVLENKVERLTVNARTIRDINNELAQFRSITDRTITGLQKGVSDLQSQVNSLVTTPSEIKRLRTEVSQLQTNLTVTQRDIKRKPLNEIHTETFKDGTKHKFRVYRSQAGLVRPHRISKDLILDDKYIDLNEPLD